MTNETAPSASERDAPTYVDTPYGLLTATGRWYHVPEDDLREYAGAVLEHVSLDRLIEWADAWVDSARTVTIWLLPVLLWAIPPVWASGAALAVYLGWTLVSPAWPSVGAARAASGLSRATIQGGYYGVTLSILSVLGKYVAVGVGLAAFILFRWGVVAWVARRVLRPLQRQLYPLPVTDQVLRGLIVRAALKYRVSVPQVDALTSDIIDNWVTESEASGTETPSPSHSDDSQ